MANTDELIVISEAIAAAIAARDTKTLAGFLAPGFVHRSVGGDATSADAFLQGIAQIPGEIVLVKLEDLRVDVAGDSAIVSGRQRAQVKIDENMIDDRRAFVDMFVRVEGKWLLRVAIDLEAAPPSSGS